MDNAKQEQVTPVVNESESKAVEITYIIGHTILWGIFWVGIFGGFQHLFETKNESK